MPPSVEVQTGPAVGISQVFEVPVLYQDLRQAEAFNQICDALENLNRVVDGVFGGIQNRVEAERNRVQNIKARLNLAKAKVQHIETNFVTKATKVHSSNKYPSRGIVKDYVSPFSGMSFQPIIHANYHLADHQHVGAIKTRDPANSITLMSEKTATESKETEEEGLGRLPELIPSVTSLLLFNTHENPYNEYSSIDNLLGKDFVVIPNDEKDKLADAPTTVATGEELPDINMVDYKFKPTLDDLPTLNFPSQLQELSMVAGDINWSTGLDLPTLEPIAPSAHLMNLPDLPIDPAALENPPKTQSVAVPSGSTTTTSVNEPSQPPQLSVLAPAAATPLPPQPPTVAIPPPPKPPAAAIPLSPQSTAVAIPPPPKPPAAAPPNIIVDNPCILPLTDIPDIVTNPHPSRESFLAQIENFRSQNLRKVREQEVNRRKPVAGSTDIFEAFKLAMERRSVAMRGRHTPARRSDEGSPPDSELENRIKMPNIKDDWSN